jgi:Ca2+-binding RTX toxin-like protein
MVRQGHLTALVRAFLIGCVVLLLAVGCAGTRSETSKKEEQGSSPQATESEEEARCDETRTIKESGSGETYRVRVTTNDIPGCPKGGLLLGTDKRDNLAGKNGDDEIRGLGGPDTINGGPGNDTIYGGPSYEEGVFGQEGDDVIYGGPSDDWVLEGGEGEDVIYGGDGNDYLGDTRNDGQRDKLYCGAGRDHYLADKKDYVDSSCEKKGRAPAGAAD